MPLESMNVRSWQSRITSSPLAVTRTARFSLSVGAVATSISPRRRNRKAVSIGGPFCSAHRRGGRPGGTPSLQKGLPVQASLPQGDGGVTLRLTGAVSIPGATGLDGVMRSAVGAVVRVVDVRDGVIAAALHVEFVDR